MRAAERQRQTAISTANDGADADAIDAGRETVMLERCWHLPKFRGERRGGKVLGAYLPAEAGNMGQLHSINMPVFGLAFDGALDLGLSPKTVNWIAGVFYRLVCLASVNLPHELRGCFVVYEGGCFRAATDGELALRVGISLMEFGEAAHVLRSVGGCLLDKAAVRVLVPVGRVVSGTADGGQLFLWAGNRPVGDGLAPTKGTNRIEVNESERTESNESETPKPTEALRMRVDVAERAEARDGPKTSPPRSFENEGQESSEATQRRSHEGPAQQVGGIAELEAELRRMLQIGDLDGSLDRWGQAMQQRLLGGRGKLRRVDRTQVRHWGAAIHRRLRERGPGEVTAEWMLCLQLAAEVEARWRDGTVDNTLAYFRVAAEAQGLVERKAGAA